MSDINYMDIKEFREKGLLAELNRTFLHPLGLALEVTIEDDGEEKLGGIWDFRDDPEGILYADKILPSVMEKCVNVQKFIEEKHKQRFEVLGYVFQDIENPQ